MTEIHYRAEPTLAAFHKDSSFVRGIRGPIGSGKSVACCWEIYLRAVAQKADANKRRRSRWVVIRNTYPELKTTTIKTWLEWFGTLGRMRWDSPPTFQIDQLLEDGTRLQLEVIFMSMETEADAKKLLSLEVTGAWINEARELPKAVITNAMSRVGRFPRADGSGWSGVIMDTNSPSTFHWWYHAAEEERPANWKFFDQPPAILRENDRYLLNPLAENLRNIPKGPDYYLDLISGNDPEWIDVMLCCDYKSIFTGKPVYKSSWNDRMHVSAQPLAILPDRELVLGFDFGLTPAAVAAQQSASGQLRILAEWCSEDMGLTQFLQNLVLPDLRAGRFRNLAVRCVGDPAGVQRTQADSQVSCASVFRNFGLDFEPAATNDFEPRRRAVLDRLNRMALGEPAYLVDPSCVMLRQGFNGGYQFALLQTRSSSGDLKFHAEPEKNLFSHVHDANQYLVMSFDPVQSERNRRQSELMREALQRSRMMAGKYRVN